MQNGGRSLPPFCSVLQNGGRILPPFRSVLQNGGRTWRKKVGAEKKVGKGVGDVAGEIE